MTILSVIGGHDREAIQTFLNVVLSVGGVKEVRLLKMGGAVQYYSDLVTELGLVHDYDGIRLVNLPGLFVHEGQPTEILIYLKSSYKSFEDFLAVAFPLLNVVFEEIGKSELDEIQIVFGDNYRGLVQKAYLDKLIQREKSNTVKVHSVALSSVYQMSKTLNSTESDAYFRCYPKIDGSLYTFDPTSTLTPARCVSLTKEIGDKIDMMVKMFTKKDASSFPNIEGTVLARFILTYLQSKSWEVACRDEKLFSRCPTVEEVALYDLKSNVAIFLPPIDEEEKSIKLPEYVQKHARDASDYIFKSVQNID